MLYHMQNPPSIKSDIKVTLNDQITDAHFKPCYLDKTFNKHVKKDLLQQVFYHNW